MTDPIRASLERQGFLVLDGGLATELEALGCDLNDPLWSARALLGDREAVRTAHRRFLEAGADCIATATYQATFEGFGARGLDARETVRLLRAAVEVAVSARDGFWADLSMPAGRLRPLVAASIGPYGAFLADGSEYRGDYGLSAAELYDFHAPRWEILAETEADLLACETTPSLEETRAYCRLAAVAHRPAWISFQCRDGAHLADGTPARDRRLPVRRGTPRRRRGRELRRSGLRFLPHNGGAGGDLEADPRLPQLREAWDAEAKRWTGPATPLDWARSAMEWRSEGADGVGGCCRVGPAAIAAIRSGALSR